MHGIICSNTTNMYLKYSGKLKQCATRIRLQRQTIKGAKKQKAKTLMIIQTVFQIAAKRSAEKAD